MTAIELLQLKAVLVAVALAVFVLWERIAPVADDPLLLRLGRASWAAIHRLLRNLSLFSLNALLSPVLVAPITMLATGFTLGLRPDWWSG